MKQFYEMEQIKYIIKIVTIGDTMVGKTSIIRRYVYDEFYNNHLATIGIDFNSKYIKMDNSLVKLLIWDTAGQERFQNITKQYYKGANGILLVYDISNRKSFERINFWMNDLKENCSIHVFSCLVGNKIDLEDKREISTEEGEIYAKDNNIDFCEVSSKTGEGISELFDKVIKGVLDKFKEEEEEEKDIRRGRKLIINTFEKDNKGCCSSGNHLEYKPVVIDDGNQKKTKINFVNKKKVIENESKNNSEIIENTPLKYKYENLSNSLSKKEIKELEENINFHFQSSDKIDLSKLNNKVTLYENNINYSSSIKKYIIQQKEKNPENYININETVNNLDNISEDLNSANDNFILSLIGKFYEDNGTIIDVAREKDQKLKDLELASIQSLFSYGNQKKFEFHFDFGKEINQQIMNDPDKGEKFLTDYKIKIAEKIKINKERLIFTDIHSGCVAVHGMIINSTKEEENSILNLNNQMNIKEIEEKPFLEELQISPQILDKKGNRHSGWGKNETRGGEKYIPPLGWYGFGLKVMDKYDNGNNDWLDYRNRKGEYSIAYIGINNLYNNKNKMIEDLNDFSENINKTLTDKLYMDEIDLRKSFFFSKGKCGDGVCVFQNPEYAENSSGFIDILGYRIKIILMCRVNPKKIRQPKNFPSCWILNPNEIRPYRILIKKIPMSPLTNPLNDLLITFVSPKPYIVNAIKSGNSNFLNLAKNKKFKEFSLKDGKKLKDDFFSIRLYSSVYFGFINEYLRTEKVLTKFRNFQGFTEEEIKSWIYCLHLSLSRNCNVKENTMVYRGVSFKFPPEIQIGSKFYLNEFLSTTTKKEFAKEWIKGKGTLMDITIKNNGINGYPNYCYYIEDITYTKKQYEVLFSCLCYYQVTNRKQEGSLDHVSLICQGFLID